MKVIGALILIVVFIVIAIFFISRSNYSFSRLSGTNSSSTFSWFPRFPNRGAVASGSGRSGANQTYQTSGNVPSQSTGGSGYQPTSGQLQNQGTSAESQPPPLSPYYHQIRIGSAYPGSFYYQGSIYIYDYYSGGKIDVSGWQIQTNRNSVFISQAVDVYDPSGLTPPSDIYLANGSILKIYSGQSAIGQNLRLNKCIGYLDAVQKFNPPLNVYCPYINRSEISGFTGQCQNYILSLGNCQLPAANPPVPNDDYACRNFLDNLNYGGCFRKYRFDSDFLRNEWDVWIGSQFMDYQHDNVRLLDRNGLLVDEYSY